MDVIDNFRRVISFRIRGLGYPEHLPRAKLDTKTASFTPVINDVYDTVCNKDAISIQRLSPEIHGSSSVLSNYNDKQVLLY
jgi:hypothetical protein